MRITLIQTAGDRRYEIRRFISALHTQLQNEKLDLQYIFVDQADNEDLFYTIEKEVDFKYIKSDRCSLSHARNIALPYVDGDIITFPDDDCWYPAGVLKIVTDYFKSASFEGITGIVKNENGIQYNNYPAIDMKLTKENLCGASSICMFLKFDKSLRFDENIGVGSSFGIGSGEESDYLMRFIDNGHTVYYKSDLIVYHPINLLSRTEDYLNKSYLYAVGAGYIAKKNHLSILYILKLLFRPFAGSLFFLLKGDFYMSRRSYCILKGRISGLRRSLIQ